jgi:hypothetical protein
VSPGIPQIDSTSGGLSNDQIDYVVSIGFARDAATNDDVDAAINGMALVYDLLRNSKHAGFRCVSRLWPLPYENESLRHKSFRGVMQFTFRGVK